MTSTTLDLVESPLQGRNLVEASAGTGKTFALAALFVRLLIEAGLTVDQILVVTFTEAATEELRGRIRERLRGALGAFQSGQSDDELLQRLLARHPDREKVQLRLVVALRSFDEAPLFTIHGFCQRVLQENAFECGAPFDAELVVDGRPLLREVIDDFWRREVFEASPALIAHALRRGLSPEAIADALARWVRTPDLRVLPETGDGALAAAEHRCQDAQETLRRLWPGARGEVGEILSCHPSLNRNRYREASVPAWITGMDLCLASSDLLHKFESLEKFCPVTLEAATKKGHGTPRHPFFDACQALAEVRRELEAELDLQVLALQSRLVAYAREELPRRKAERNIRSFDDLLTAVRSALTGRSGAALAAALRDRYRAALIDEFQDTDPVQYGIFRSVFPDERCPLFLIGDPKQAIYGFRGADVFAYLDAVSHVERHWTLGRNWRSTPDLIRAVNALFSSGREPFVFSEIPFHPVEAGDGKDRVPLLLDGEADRSPLQVWFARREGDRPIPGTRAAEILPAAVASEILRLLREGAAGRASLGARSVEPGDMAVLVRTNLQARQVKAALQELQIPAVLHGSGTLFASAEAAELLRVLSAAAEPRSERRIRAALVTDLLGLSGDDLATLDREEDEREERFQRFARYRDLWVERGFAVMAQAFLTEERVRERLLPLPDGERRVTNVLHAVEVLQRAALEGKLGPEGLVRWLGRRIDEQADAAEYEIRLETDERAVKIVTVHSSKGLEYPIVFCPFSWGGSRAPQGPVTFHDPEEPLRVVLDLGSESLDANRHLAERENLAENLRLLYVALTRARNRCYLVWGAFKGAETSGLAHLLTPVPAGSGPAAADAVGDLAGRALGLTDSQMLEQVRRLSEQTVGAVAVAELPEATPFGARYAPSGEDGRELHCRPFAGRIPRDATVTSYSALVSGRDETAEFPDRDEWTSRATEASLPGREGGARSFFDFPRGSRAGTCLHEILEDLDYAAPPAQREAAARESLERHGFDQAWAGPVAAALGHLLREPLDPCRPTLTLFSIPQTARVNELEFYLPTGLLTPRGLARVFAAHAGPSVPAALPEALEELGFRPNRGFLKGFIDLVFQAEGRYYLADWKSNHLGDRFENYGPENLQGAVDEHLYGLQYHLYTAALHRHLATRLPGYDYDQHFGGVFYVFLRGVDPANPGSGIHRARPSLALTEALCAYLERGGEP